MARNSNPWCKIFYRDWLESERVMEMSCAAEGIYMRCLLLQTVYGNIPHNLDKLCLLLRKQKHEVEKSFGEVLPHFEIEIIDGEERLFNRKHREQLEEDEGSKSRKSKNYSRAAKKREESKRKQDSTTILPKSCKDSGKILRVRASDSVSVSVSDSVSSKTSDLKASSKTGRTGSDGLGKSDEKFCEFYDLYPRKINRKDAYSAYRKHVDGDDDHAKLISATRAAIDGLFAGRPTDKIPYPAVWINKLNWQDDGADLSATPQIHSGFLQPGSRDPVQAYRNRIQKYDPSKAKPLTPEEIEEDAKVEVPF